MEESSSHDVIEDDQSMKEDEELGHLLAGESSSENTSSTNLDGPHQKQQQSSSSLRNFCTELSSWRGTSGGKVVSACTFYSFCSVSMVLTNKSLASRCVELSPPLFLLGVLLRCRITPTLSLVHAPLFFLD